MYIRCRIPNAGLKKCHCWLCIMSYGWLYNGLIQVYVVFRHRTKYVLCRIPNVAPGVTSRLSEAKGVSENETDSAA